MADVKFDCKTTFPEKVSVIGAAKSGIAAARFFSGHNVSILISDLSGDEVLARILELNHLSKCAYEGGGHTDRILDADLIVISPGVPSELPIIQQANELNIPVWSEMELGFRASRAPFLAVTGSSGKSTTVSLTGAALNAAGIEHVVAGNIGIPVIDAVPALSGKAFAVVEVSSFQLETIDRFRPHAAVILNFMKNHLDRYPTVEAYYTAKKEIARNMTRENYLILNANDPQLLLWGKEMASSTTVVYFGDDVAGSDAFWCDGTRLRYRFNGNEGVVGECGMMRLKGRHNYDNASVAAALAMIAGAEHGAAFRGMCTFGGLPHRLEFINEIDGVTWFNDSKSTTAESIDCAVNAFQSGVHLIAGGKDKGCDFSIVRESIRNRVKDIVLIGEAAGRMREQWSDLVPVSVASTLEEAVAIAGSHASDGESVVFSPGCSSFDMFRNFEDRGDRFKVIVNTLAAKGSIL